MARFAVGHTREVAARHYADLPSLGHCTRRPSRTPLRGCSPWQRHACSLPTGRKRRWQRRSWPTADPPPGDVDDLLTGDQDVWLAGCAGFYASPFAHRGRAMPEPFWGCLDCSNAVITARKLPAIIAFLAFIEGERAGLIGERLAAQVRPRHARIVGQVLPAFSDEVVAEARARGQLEHEPYLPPEARA